MSILSKRIENKISKYNSDFDKIEAELLNELKDKGIIEGCTALHIPSNSIVPITRIDIAYDFEINLYFTSKAHGNDCVDCLGEFKFAANYK